MNYINPYDLLGISTANLSDIDSKTVLKEKKKLLQEIELSDTDSIRHSGIDLTKADCLTAVDDLDNKDKKEFHFFIFKNKPLNDFLSKGSLLFFERFQVESIYKLPEFLDFISPYFANQYDKALTNNFKHRNINEVTKILSVKPITNEAFFENCYKGTYSIIKGFENEIKSIIKEVELKQSPFIEKNFYGLDSLIKEKINVDVLNLLPAYFQSLRNQLAQSIRNLARDINNDPYSLYEPAYKIIEIANSLSTDGLVKQTIIKGYYTIKKNYEDELPKQTQASKILTPASNKVQLEDEEPPANQESTVKEEKKDNSANNIFGGFLIGIVGLFIWAYFSSTVQRVMLIIATLMYAVWIYNLIKKPGNYDKQPKGQVLLYGLSFVICIGGFIYPILSVLFVSYFLIVFLHLFYSGVLSKPKKDTGALAGLVYLILAIGITAFWYYQNQLNSGISSSAAQQESTVPISNNYSNSQTEDNSQKNYPIVDSHEVAFYKNGQYIQEPTYSKISLKSGDISDCIGIKSKYGNNINSKLIISAESTDAALKIFDYETDRCIRFVFIRDGTTYTVNKIPEGRYYLKIAYGNDWEFKDGDPICKGHFSSHVSYKKDGDIYDFNKKYYGNGRTSTPYYTLKLYRTYSNDNLENNVTSNSISENDFNNN